MYLGKSPLNCSTVSSVAVVNDLTLFYLQIQIKACNHRKWWFAERKCCFTGGLVDQFFMFNITIYLKC